MVEWNGDSLLARVRQAAMRGVTIATEIVKVEAVSLILDTPKSGRTYTRGGVSHRASAPGEPPASDTGWLVQNIDTQYDHTALQGFVVARAEYAPYLEFGTRRMEPRPFLRPALANKSSEITRVIAAEVQRELG